MPWILCAKLLRFKAGNVVAGLQTRSFLFGPCSAGIPAGSLVFVVAGLQTGGLAFVAPRGTCPACPGSCRGPGRETGSFLFGLLWHSHSWLCSFSLPHFPISVFLHRRWVAFAPGVYPGSCRDGTAPFEQPASSPSVVGASKVSPACKRWVLRVVLNQVPAP
jgi:hypothetical protein